MKSIRSKRSLGRSSFWLRSALAAIVLVHFAVVLWHGAAHNRLAVPLAAWQMVFVGLVIALLPLIGAGLLWTRHRRAAVQIIALSMFASLVFGLVHHYMLMSPDHVMAGPAGPWQHSFVLSSALLVVTETIGTVVGVFVAL